MEYTITEATVEDAALIAEGIMAAIGEDICINLGGGADNLSKVKELFTCLAEKETSQYSYRNTLVAMDSTGTKAGVAVAYDGALLHSLRKDFVEEYNRLFDSILTEEELDDETGADQIYIDTLMVRPGYRRRGIGRRLIEAVEQKFSGSGKPLGLLVDYTNPNAKNLYEKAGFKSKGSRKFCGVDMEHMQKS